MEVYLVDCKAYLEVERKNDANAEQGDNADEDEQIFLEPGSNKTSDKNVKWKLADNSVIQLGLIHLRYISTPFTDTSLFPF